MDCFVAARLAMTASSSRAQRGDPRATTKTPGANPLLPHRARMDCFVAARLAMTAPSSRAQRGDPRGGNRNTSVGYQPPLPAQAPNGLLRCCAPRNDSAVIASAAWRSITNQRTRTPLGLPRCARNDSMATSSGRLLGDDCAVDATCAATLARPEREHSEQSKGGDSARLSHDRLSTSRVRAQTTNGQSSRRAPPRPPGPRPASPAASRLYSAHEKRSASRRSRRHRPGSRQR